MTWFPGKPVVTAEDYTEWQLWRRFRILKGQRRRRARSRRIDYYASPEANETIDKCRTKTAGGDASSIINRIIEVWAAARRNLLEQTRDTAVSGTK